MAGHGWDIGTVGGFFALRGQGPDGPGSPDAVPLADVYAGDPAPLRRRVDTVAARLRAPERRVAVSVAHLGLAARLWSTGLGAAALHGAVPDLAGLRWDADAAAPDDLWLDVPWPDGGLEGHPAAGDGQDPAPAAPTASTAPAALADRLRAVVLDAHLTPLAATVHREYRISDALLRGNSGSALAGAVRALRDWSRAHDRPEAGRRAAAVAHALFALPELRGAGSLRAGAFRRASCCLYYRCPGGGLCGDCCFDHPPARSSVRAAGE